MTTKPSALVVRSQVPPAKNYAEYRRYLRRDFWYSCAYCTMTEAEAQAVRFTIDHYEPVSARPDLRDEYSNLMYACDECNRRKGSLTPPATAREAGVRFFRPDSDDHDEHFELNGPRVQGQTPIGEFTVDAIDLNRNALRRLRQLRERILKNQEYLLEGVQGLRGIELDKLPPAIRGTALVAQRRSEELADRLEEDIDELLRTYARSPLIEDDPVDKESQHARAEKMKGYRALFPGTWRNRQRSKR